MSHLKHLQINGLSPGAAFILVSMIPDPSHTLDTCSDRMSTPDMNRQIFKRVEHFRTTVIGSLAPPIVTFVLSTSSGSGMLQHKAELFSCTGRDDGRHLRYCRCSFESTMEPALQYPTAFRCEVNHDTKLEIPVPDNVRGVKELSIVQAIRAKVNFNTSLRALEAWVRARHQQGRPLKLVKFKSCHEDARVFFERMSADGLARSVLWVDDDGF
jgi:hypothetical protein